MLNRPRSPTASSWRSPFGLIFRITLLTMTYAIPEPHIAKPNSCITTYPAAPRFSTRCAARKVRAKYSHRSDVSGDPEYSRNYSSPRRKPGIHRCRDVVFQIDPCCLTLAKRLPHPQTSIPLLRSNAKIKRRIHIPNRRLQHARVQVSGIR